MKRKNAIRQTMVTNCLFCCVAVGAALTEGLSTGTPLVATFACQAITTTSSHSAPVFTAWPFAEDPAVIRQDETAKALGGPKELVLDLGNKVTMKLVLIPAGKFSMGSAKEEVGHNEDESPQHEVTISRPFYMGIYEVTQEQYRTIMWMRSLYSKFDKGPTLPAERVSWESARDFCEKLSANTGCTVSLPTEAQWEYACRSGTETPFNTGETISRREANVSLENDHGDLMSVGSFAPNTFGLHDMHGNAQEWCQDWYDESQYARSEGEDPVGPISSEEMRHVVRGGTHGDTSGDCRSANRRGFNGGSDSGFRVVVELDGKPAYATPEEKAAQLIAAARALAEYDRREKRRISVKLAALGIAAKPLILSAINDPNSAVHECAASALSYMPEISDIPVLLRDIRWAESDIADIAVKMLGHEAIQPLIDAIENEGPTCERAIGILYEIDPNAAADPVFEVGRNGKDKGLRYSALSIALAHGDQRALDPLLEAVETDVRSADVCAVDAEFTYTDWSNALDALFRYGGQKGADLFVSALEQRKINLWDVHAADDYLRAYPCDARLVPHMIKGLDDKNHPCLSGIASGLLHYYLDDPRAKAALISHRWLNEEKTREPLDKESVETLLEKLLGADDDDAADIVAELARRRDNRAVQPLLDFIAQARDRARWSAIIALGQIGDPSAIEPLIGFLSTEFPWNGRYAGNWDDRIAVVEALGKLKANKAVEKLIVIANDAESYGAQHSKGAEYAVEALGEIGDERCLAALNQVLRTSPEISVRQAAWRSIRKCQGQPHTDVGER